MNIARLVETVAFSELLREPTATVDRLNRVRAILLRRRGADDLVLMQADRAEQERNFVETAAKLLGELARRDGKLVGEVVARVLPWVRFLPADSVQNFINEFVETAIAAGSIGNTAPVAQLLIEWQHTAEIYADPELLAILKAPTFGDYGLVQPPEVE